MFRHGWIFGLLLTCAALAPAQAKKITVEFPDQGDRTVYLQEASKLADPPLAPRTANGKSIDLETSLDPATDGKDVMVVVVDSKKNDAAVKPFPEAAKLGTWKVADKDFTRVALVQFLVKAKEGPVAAGVLKFDSKAGSNQVVLTNSDNGTATLRLVEPGDVKVSFDYKSDGASKSLPAQTFEVKTGLGKPTAFTLDVNDKVDVVKQPEPAAKPSKKADTASDDEEDAPTKAVEKARKDTPNALGSAIGSFFSMIFGLLVVAGVAYGLWWYIKNNQKQVQTVLQQAGVPVNQDPADPTGAAPVAPQAPKPIEKIVLDPSAAALTPAAPVSSAPTAKNPRLVGDDGSLFLLAEGSNVVGREPGLAVSLVGESSVSRNHAQLLVSGGQVTVADSGSTNGSYVNGTKLTSASPLRPGDVVQFGAKRFRYEE